MFFFWGGGGVISVNKINYMFFKCAVHPSHFCKYFFMFM